MNSPKENTEVIRLLREVKNSIWKSLTPIKPYEFNETVAGKLSFSSLEDSVFGDIQTPENLKRKLINAEVELQASQARLKERESVISNMEPANKKLCFSFESKIEEYRKQSEIDTQRIEELEGHLKWAKKQASAARNELQEAKHQRKVEQDQLEMKILSLQQEISNLKVELSDVKSEKTETVRKLNIELGKLELKTSMQAEEAEKSFSYIESLKKKNSEMVEQAALCKTLQTELKEAQDKIRSLENKIEADKDAALIVASRQSDLKTLNDLQKENRIIKEELSKYKESNIVLFQEKMWSMQQKLSQAEQKCVAVSKLQIENEQLKLKLQKWEELFDDSSSPYKSPSSFCRRLSQYQQNEAVLTNKVSQLKSYFLTLEKQKKEKEELVKSLTHKLQLSQDNFARQESVIKRLTRKIIFLTKEKENSRKLLDSYLGETTVSGAAINAEQISYLEEMNIEYKKALEKTEKEIDSLNEKLQQLNETNESSEYAAELRKLKEENSIHLARIETLQKEKTDILSNQNKQQESNENVSSFKVVHLNLNPLDQSNKRHLQMFHKLQEENDYLKKRVKVLEEEGIEAKDVTMKVQHKLQTEGADSTLQSLKEQLVTADRQRRYILENARLKANEFREAIYQLTGYRVDVPTSETYKLSHVYANARDDYLLFKVNSQGIQLIETEYSKQLTNQMELYLHRYDSFPAFLANHTMELFNQQTFMLQN